MREITKGITVNQGVRFGKPVIKGTRVTVDVVLGKLAGGIGFEEIMKEYDITKRDILNAINYAADLVGREEIRIAS
ncbi:MAG: DUF433 domain-containing protein [Patescibacteria group bacterium]